MAYSVDKTGEITFGGWEKGIAASPHKGVGDIKCGNISTEFGEVSVNYSRVAQTNVTVGAGTGTFTGTNGSSSFTYTGTSLKQGTVILVGTSTVTGVTNGNYYYLLQNGLNTYQLATTFARAQSATVVVAGSDGTFTFGTLAMATPIDYAIEQPIASATSYDKFRYYILDSNAVVWCSGAGGVIAAAGRLTTATIWTPISASGSSATNNGNGANATGIAIIYGTTNGKIGTVYIFIFGDGDGTGTNGISYILNPSTGANAWTAFGNVKYIAGYSHRAILANDQVLYYCDGPVIGCLYQSAPGTPFDPTSSATYTFVAAEYYLNPTDAATRIAQIPNSGGVGIIVGGLQNNLYTYPSAKSSSANTGQQTNILWMPEANTQYLLSCNNFVIVFPGSKGNIYLTNGSSVVPILSVPDYVSGSVSFQQEPYFTWGGAMYLRGRVWFGIQDTTATHIGNCGGVWSFVPNFAAFAEQDTGTALRLENHNATAVTAYTACPNVIFSGQDTQAQGGTANNVNGPQYVAAWTQIGGTTAACSVDFSSSTPYADGSTIIETDVVPVGTFLNNKTYQQIEYKLGAALATGESVAFKYRLNMGTPFVAAGTVQQPANTTTDPTVSGYCPINFQNAEILQLQIILTSTASNPSFVRLQEVYVR